MQHYDHKKIEKKWQDKWEKEHLFDVKDNDKEDKYYCLVEFPYASGEGVHNGHLRPYTAMDIVARKKRMEGKNVLYPIGWDAFGLPTENYAIKTKRSPKEITKENTDNFRRQLKSLGFSFDWSREINTSDPEYYKWTQWIFLKFFEHGLAYKDKKLINWCKSCKIGLANEEVVNGVCERCGGEVEKREKEQWMLKITDYAERLYNDIDKTDYLEKIKLSQKNWIGKSEGALLKFQITSTKSQTNSKSQITNTVKIFTTRPDTLFGVTYLVLAPEHKLVSELKEQITNWGDVEKYIKEVSLKTEIERTADGKEKTGVELKGIKAINPANNEEVPIFIADYVMADYGTGSIMAVPAHDERDLQFALKYNLEIKPVFARVNSPKELFPNYELLLIKTCKEDGFAIVGEGFLIKSGEFNNLSTKEARKKITEYVGGEMKTTYKLRDWVFSRQRYWGEPMPLIFCPECKKSVENHKSQITNFKQNTKHKFTKGELLNPGWFADENLPVELPDVEKYEPTDTGESPLANIKDWVETKCPKCGGSAKRETDTMPNWAGSSWYWLRYADNKNNKEFASLEKIKEWTPVDWYNGGMEHATLHLLYARFWQKFLFDIGLVPNDEPFIKRTAHGMILGEGGEKMSKSRGNVINPDEIVDRFGADTLRLYEMFIGPFDQPVMWDSNSIVGVRRFVEKVWKLNEKVNPQVKSSLGKENSKPIEVLLHQTIKKVSEDIENMKFNTAISSMMIFVNELSGRENIDREIFEKFLKILSPFAPHISEELWEQIGNKESISKQDWLEWDEGKIKESKSEIKIVVQINGKIRGEIEISKDMTEEEIKKLAIDKDFSKKWISDKKPKKILYIKDKLVSIVA